jgi:hypothetical protein
MRKVSYDDRFPAQIIQYAVWLYFRFPVPCRKLSTNVVMMQPGGGILRFGFICQRIEFPTRTTGCSGSSALPATRSFAGSADEAKAQ